MVAIKGKPKTEYTNVGIPKEMAEEIQRIVIDETRFGFRSMQEFVIEATRRSIVYYGGVGNNLKKS